jgi:uncharacterized protein YegP (UPF0339 family)
MYYRIYKDRVGQWRWSYKAQNGNTIADSGESYYNRADCLRGIQIMKGSGPAPVVE